MSKVVINVVNIFLTSHCVFNDFEGELRDAEIWDHTIGGGGRGSLNLQPPLMYSFVVFKKAL